MASASGRRTILISGAARGLGAACAARFAARGDNVALVGLERDALEAGARACGRSTIALEADIRDPAALRRAVTNVQTAFGAIDVVIANAGIGSLGPIATTDPDAFETMVDVNIKGTFHTLQAVLPAMHNGRGYIMVVSSASAGARIAGFGGYSATKAATETLAGVAGVELASSGVRVGLAYFSFLETELVNDVRGTAGFQSMLRSIPWPVRRVTSLAGAVRAIERGVDHRARRVVHPAYVKPLLALRTAVWRLDRSRAEKTAPKVVAAFARDAADSPGR